MALERHAHEPVEQLRVGDPVGLEQLGVDARGGEPGDRVELVHEHPVALHEEVHARHPGAADDPEHLDGQPPHRLERRLRQAGGHDQLHPAALVLGLVVVPAVAALQDDLARPRGDRVRVAEHRALHLHALHQALHQGDRVVLEGVPRAPRRAPPPTTPSRSPPRSPSRAGFTNSGGVRPAQVERAAVARHRVLHLRHAVRGQQVLEERLVHRHAPTPPRPPPRRARRAAPAAPARCRPRRTARGAPGTPRRRRAARRPARAPAALPSLVQRPSRSSRTSTGVWPASARPGPDRLGGHERHLVLAGAPAAQHRDPHGVGVSSGCERVGRSSNAPTKITTVSPLSTSSPTVGRLVQHQAVLAPARRSARSAPTSLEARGLQLPPRVRHGQADHVGHRHLLRAARHGDRDPGAGVDLGAGRRVLGDHLVLRRVRRAPRAPPP